MRTRAFVAFLSACALLLLVAAPVTASTESVRVIQFWYTWGDHLIMGAKVWTSIATNLTLSVNHTAPGNTSFTDAAEFHLGVFAPGGDPYPAANGTNPFPYPQISAAYDSQNLQLHQVLEFRFLRLVEFQDSNGDGAYSAGDPIDSQVDLANLSIRYSPVSVQGLDNAGNFIDLPVLNHYPNVCCGESWDGWLSQNDTGFSSFAGLHFSLAASSTFNFSVSAYQWFTPQAFHGANVTPTSVKLDFRIEDYPYVSTTSRLALEANLTSFSQGTSSNWNMVPWPEGQGLSSDAGNTSAFFAWSGEAYANGVLAPVVSTVLPGDAYTRTLYLSYPHAAYLAHDPVLGISDKRISGGSNVIPPSGPGTSPPDPTFIAFVATLIAGSAVVVAAERRKR